MKKPLPRVSVAPFASKVSMATAEGLMRLTSSGRKSCEKTVADDNKSKKQTKKKEKRKTLQKKKNTFIYKKKKKGSWVWVTGLRFFSFVNLLILFVYLKKF